MLLEAGKFLNQEAYSAFNDSLIERINYYLNIQLIGLIFNSRLDLEQKSYLLKKKSDQYTLKEVTGYSRQCVHQILLLYHFESSYFDNRWYFRNMVKYC